MWSRRVDLLARQLPEVEAHRAATAPQCGHAVGELLGGPGRGHDEGRATGDELADHDQGQGIEQVGVVDDDERPSARAGALDEARDRCSDDVDDLQRSRSAGIGQLQVAGREVRQRAERDGRCRQRPDHPVGRAAELLGGLAALLGEAGLPDTRRAEHDDAGHRGVVEGGVDILELERPTDEGPGRCQRGPSRSAVPAVAVVRRRHEPTLPGGLRRSPTAAHARPRLAVMGATSSGCHLDAT